MCSACGRAQALKRVGFCSECHDARRAEEAWIDLNGALRLFPLEPIKDRR